MPEIQEIRHAASLVKSVFIHAAKSVRDDNKVSRSEWIKIRDSGSEAVDEGPFADIYQQARKQFDVNSPTLDQIGKTLQSAVRGCITAIKNDKIDKLPEWQSAMINFSSDYFDTSKDEMRQLIFGR